MMLAVFPILIERTVYLIELFLFLSTKNYYLLLLLLPPFTDSNIIFITTFLLQ